MEQKLYRLLGVNQYRKFVIKVKKKYDQWRGKPDTDNYFLKDYSEEGIVFLKSQLSADFSLFVESSQTPAIFITPVMQPPTQK